MNSSVTASFRKDFARLPGRIQVLAREKYRLWQRDPRHPSLHFKKVGEYWSVRIDDNYRAIGRIFEGRMYWFRICAHDDYEGLI
ncbi:MAG TPA: hypothetical protein VIT91_01280 [Chthoniobacterales bacterium]